MVPIMRDHLGLTDHGNDANAARIYGFDVEALTEAA